MQPRMQQCTKKRFNAGYAASLNDAARTRYTEKISLIGGVDPYEEMLWDDDRRSEVASDNNSARSAST